MLSHIKNLDLAYLEKRLAEQERWAPADAREAVRRYKNFLFLLYKYPGCSLAPAPDIDEVWHNHILHTREYDRDCQEIFGRYLHHAPAQDSGREEKKAMEESLSRASDLYIREFNEPYFLELDISAFW